MNTTDRTDLAELHRRAVERFARQVDNLQPGDWTRPTPCDEWNVRDLVNHVAVENLWTPPLLHGRTIAEVGDAFDGDQLGSAPAQAFREAAAGAIDVVTVPGALDRTVHLSAGETEAGEYVWQLTADHLIHAWDLAHAVGGDEHLDADLVQACSEWFAEREELYRSAGAIGPRPETTSTDPQSQLLAAFGRIG